jgi:hypothetical protein
MIFTISSLMVLAGCMLAPWLAVAEGGRPWLAVAEGERPWLAVAEGEGGWAPIVTMASTTPIMIRMPV